MASDPTAAERMRRYRARQKSLTFHTPVDVPYDAFPLLGLSDGDIEDPQKLGEAVKDFLLKLVKKNIEKPLRRNS